MKRYRRRTRLPFLGILIAAMLIAALYLFLERFDAGTDHAGLFEETGQAPRDRGLTQKPPGERAAARERRIAVIIDDIGHDLRLVEELADIGEPVAFAVLPYAPYATEAARILHRAGKEILLHLPMEPRSYPAEDPGAGALFVAMDAGEIRSQIDRSLAVVPYVSGVNNHMGSRFMEDEAGLAVVMEELAKRGLYFVDSLTSADSRGREMAARAGVRFTTRSAFIDHTPGYAAALAVLAHPPWQGPDQSAMLLIGHPHAETVRALAEARRFWRKEGMRVIPVSAYIRSPRTGGGKEELADRQTATAGK
jgi:polysaccharide deacetylase 2 family uncharacterized protein YibQ